MSEITAAMRRYGEAFRDAADALRTSLRNTRAAQSAAVSEPPEGTQDDSASNAALLREEIAAGRWGVQTGTGWPGPENPGFHVPHDPVRQQTMLDLNLATGAGSVGRARREKIKLH